MMAINKQWRHNAINHQQGRTTLLWILAGVIALSTLAYGLYQISRNHKFQFFGELVYRVKTDDKVIALTFDDGPSPKRTQAVLEILARENIRATFYLNGRPMRANPEEAKLIIASGHEVGNHSYSHKRMVFMSYQEVSKEVESTNDIIRGLGYQDEIHFRPPYGKNLFVLPYYLSQKEITTITWDVETETFNVGEDTPELITQRALQGAKPGSIILLHVMYGDGSTLTALPNIIQGLKQKGYSFATVTELLARKG